MMDTGRIHIYFGDGKGKTTAAVGQAVRAAGHGFRVLFFQFLKDNSSNERKILEQISNITCLPGREQVKFVSRMNGDEKAELLHYNNKALDEIVKFCSPFDLLVMDEALCAVGLKVLSEEKLISFLQHKPRGLEIVLTGHQVSDRMKEIADCIRLSTLTTWENWRGKELSSNCRNIISFLNKCEFHDNAMSYMIYYNSTELTLRQERRDLIDYGECYQEL